MGEQVEVDHLKCQTLHVLLFMHLIILHVFLYVWNVQLLLIIIVVCMLFEVFVDIIGLQKKNRLRLLLWFDMIVDYGLMFY